MVFQEILILSEIKRAQVCKYNLTKSWSQIGYKILIRWEILQRVYLNITVKVLLIGIEKEIVWIQKNTPDCNKPNHFRKENKSKMKTNAKKESTKK